MDGSWLAPLLQEKVNGFVEGPVSKVQGAPWLGERMYRQTACEFAVFRSGEIPQPRQAGDSLVCKAEAQRDRPRYQYPDRVHSGRLVVPPEVVDDQDLLE